MILTSSCNPRIKKACKLRNKRERDATQSFLVEGYRELVRAIQGKVVITTLFYCPSHFLGSNEQVLVERIGAQKDGEVFEVSPSLFKKLSYRDRPDGLLAICSQIYRNVNDLTLHKTDPPFFLVAESIEKPGNLGSILRSADGAGVDALFVCDRCTDIYNPNVVRASVGTLFSLPVLELTSDETISYLRRHGVKIIATSPHAKDLFTQVDLSPPIAIVVGSEQFGLSSKWMEVADLIVHIPMNGVADSLNVATATTLLLYEVLRQRA